MLRSLVSLGVFGVGVGAGVPAAEAAGRGEAVYFVHGVQWDESADCEATWKDAKRVVRARGLSGALVTWGYYRGDTRCTYRVDGTLDTGIVELGRRLAWDVYLRHSRYGRAVDVVGHSMGGLVAAAAVAGVREYGGGAWPPFLKVRDVVTLGTPFGGVTCSSERVQCRDLRAGSGFLRWLAAHQNPQGRGGTDWTLVGAHDDRRVGIRSALGGRARHKVAYLPKQRITHYNLHHLAGDGRWRFRYTNDGARTVRTTSKGAAPLHVTAAALTSAAR
ncbi:hypothetical protein [Spirillospora sp. CA-294931]|uniref:alpha/beta hydrolase n=1 Tax=Spirillospora sp. CA-294931 TaxID=3240042 RepID=UPI003D93F821